MSTNFPRLGLFLPLPELVNRGGGVAPLGPQTRHVDTGSVLHPQPRLSDPAPMLQHRDAFTARNRLHKDPPDSQT